MPLDAFDAHIRMMPEPKLELLDGRFLVGNSAGNMQLLRYLLDGWGPVAALPMAPAELWRQALHQGFRQFDPPPIEKPLDSWHAWAAQLAYAIDLPPAGPMVDGPHAAARERLTMNLFRLAGEHQFAHVSGRDVVVRLGEDALTPDVFAVGSQRAHRLNEHYLDGPANLVVEILLPGHETYDGDIKRCRYAAAGVEDFWIIDPRRRSAEFLRLAAQQYRACAADADGKYRPATFPGLAFQLDLLWKGESWIREPNPFSVEAEMPRISKKLTKGGSGWGDLAFDPLPGLEARRLSFAEFMSWAPPAKFEVIDGKRWVGGSRGSRNVIGMILRTEGLARAVTVQHPHAWVMALMQAEQERATDAERRRHCWEVARRAAAELREQFEFSRLVVIGDLVRPKPLNAWSDITLVAFDLTEDQDIWDASRYLYKHYRDEIGLNLIEYDHATRSEQEEAAAAGVEV